MPVLPKDYKIVHNDNYIIKPDDMFNRSYWDKLPSGEDNYFLVKDFYRHFVDWKLSYLKSEYSGSKLASKENVQLFPCNKPFPYGY